MSVSFSPPNKKNITAYLLFTLLLIRAFFNGVIPLMDKTEARYAEISRIMSETGEWIVLQIDYGLPFWAKPPLSTWLSALSITAFSSHEFFVRLPYFLISILMVLWVGKYRSSSKMSFFLPGLILCTLPEFFLHAGVVSTDTFLAFSVSLVMLSFWEGIQEKGAAFWRYLLFVGMGIGLLAKGPIVGVLTVPPLLLWCGLSGFQWKKLRRFPLVSGTALTLIIALPWYVMAELRSPGFIDYFIVGEHFKRYLDSSWSGDKYGFPKQQPLGIVWLFFAGAVLPWVPIFIKKIALRFAQVRKDSWALFLLLWCFWTPLFFTTSKSLIHPYILPIMVPFALLIVHYWDTVKAKNSQLVIACLFPLLLIPLYSTGVLSALIATKSDKNLVEHSIISDYSLFSLNEKTYSSQYYSKGKVQVISVEELKRQLRQNDPFFVLITQEQLENLDERTKDALRLIKKTREKGVYRSKN
ncbi:MAG: ArnT family glycosyltransferase [Flavobacteriaceae bacterium]